MHSRNSTIVPAITLSPTSIVTNLATGMNAGPYGAVVVVQIGLTLSSNEFGLSDRPDDVRVEAVTQQRALRQIRVRVAAEHRHESNSGASQKHRWSATIAVLARGAVDHAAASHSHATSITATPPHNSSDDSTSPWPNRSQDEVQ